MSYAAVLHADMTECDHPGDPVLTPGRPPRCPAGLDVTHVRAGATVMTLDEAAAAFAALAAAWAASAGALLALMGEVAGRWRLADGARGLSGDPTGDGPAELAGQLALPGT